MMNIKSKIVTECSIQRKRSSICKSACYNGFSLNYFILAVSIEEIVVEHELAKDTLRVWHPLYS